MDSNWDCLGCSHKNDVSSLEYEKCGSPGKELANKQMANGKWQIIYYKVKGWSPNSNICVISAAQNHMRSVKCEPTVAFLARYLTTTNTVFISYHAVNADTLNFINGI